MVALSTLMRFVQEARSQRAAEALRGRVGNQATVLRRDATGRRVARSWSCPSTQLVPGDVLRLSAGDMIPADLRLLAAKDLFVSQSAMTGESLPVEKFAERREPRATTPLEQRQPVLHGHERRQRLGHRAGGRHRPQHLLRHAGRAARRRSRRRAHRVPDRASTA